MNKNGLAPAVSAIIVIVIVVVASVIAAYALGGGMAPPASGQAVTVYIDGVKQGGNYSEAQALTWGSVAAGMTYTKNFTVVNNDVQPLTLKLYTAEPTGATQSWAKNLTTVAASDKAESSLVLSLAETVSSGKYTWRLLAVNGTAPTPTPTASVNPTPTPTPTPNTLQFTITQADGVKNITITYNSETPFVILGSQLPKTYLFTTGDKIKFNIALEADYIWNGWDFNDGTHINMNNPVIVTKTGNFTLSPNVILEQEVT
jgi:hypothetical protein